MGKRYKIIADLYKYTTGSTDRVKVSNESPLDFEEDDFSNALSKCEGLQTGANLMYENMIKVNCSHGLVVQCPRTNYPLVEWYIEEDGKKICKSNCSHKLYNSHICTQPCGKV